MLVFVPVSIILINLVLMTKNKKCPHRQLNSASYHKATVLAATTTGGQNMGSYGSVVLVLLPTFDDGDAQTHTALS